MADCERRALPGTDHEVLVALEQEGERKRTAQMRQRRFHRRLRRIAFLQVGLDEMNHHLGVGLGGKLRTLALQLGAQLAEILDDAVVHHGDVLGRVRMRIGLVRLAMGGPAGMADAGVAVQRLAAQPLLEVLQLALGTPPLEMVALQRRDAGGVIAAIFQPLECTDQLLGNRRASQNTDNATHLTNISHLIMHYGLISYLIKTVLSNQYCIFAN